MQNSLTNFSKNFLSISIIFNPWKSDTMIIPVLNSILVESVAYFDAKYLALLSIQEVTALRSYNLPH
jgi:hypothetical protein